MNRNIVAKSKPRKARKDVVSPQAPSRNKPDNVVMFPAPVVAPEMVVHQANLKKPRLATKTPSWLK